jgi:hypothetical protein
MAKVDKVLEDAIAQIRTALTSGEYGDRKAHIASVASQGGISDRSQRSYFFLMAVEAMLDGHDDLNGE